MNNKINFQKLQQLNLVLRAKHDLTKDNQAIYVLGRSSKVAEEYGELMSEMLSSLGLQRRAKLDKFDKENLKKEYGDLILASLLLGLALDLDIEDAISSRLDEKYEEHVVKGN